MTKGVFFPPNEKYSSARCEELPVSWKVLTASHVDKSSFELEVFFRVSSVLLSSMPADHNVGFPSSSLDIPKRFAPLQLSIEEPVHNLDEAIVQLKQCDSTELRRARRHHRRALGSLRNGGYSGLSETTREHHSGRLRKNLDAPSHVLASPTDADADYESSGDSQPLSSRIRAFSKRLW
ncbi:MAG: hypothetical protein BRD55_10055 [Bacteroidetes bacterium SW_9_63_38]|nr:MAG: hypothetical protein BRD55_10055 [Bacteroidetes bacterium SW_9_63_38]